MMGTLKKILTNPRIIVLVVLLILAVIAINPAPGQEGVAIRSVIKNSSAADAGIPNPSPHDSPRAREILLSINNRNIESVNDYYSYIADLAPEQPLTFKTNKGAYKLVTKPLIEVTELNETETIMVNETQEVNETINGTTMLVNKTVEVPVTRNKVKTEVVGTEDIGLRVYDAPTTNLRKGLDLEGGSRIILQPEEEVTFDEMDIIISNMKERLNVYGLTDIVVREVRDLSGNSFVLVELAGASEEESRDLIAQQGKFEAKIGNDTVFKGGDDIPYVCITADCSRIERCSQYDGGWTCRFSFAISITPAAAQRQADLTKDLQIVEEGGEQYLSKNLDLFLDDELVNSLRIGASLQGRPEATEIAISGSGVGKTQEEATFDALASMKHLQTILVTGSLPVKMNVVKMDAVSSVLGKEFTNNAILVGLAAIVAVFIVVLVRYRRFIISIPVVATMMSEVVLLLGLAALVGWNLDLAAIAGIIIAVGTGVDDQLVIIDEVLTEGSNRSSSLKDRIKKAFFIIFAAFFTTFVAMIFLVFAGAGLLKGFALTTIAGISFGVFVTRPAFAFVIELLIDKYEKKE